MEPMVRCFYNTYTRTHTHTEDTGKRLEVLSVSVALVAVVVSHRWVYDIPHISMCDV